MSRSIYLHNTDEEEAGVLVSYWSDKTKRKYFRTRTSKKQVKAAKKKDIKIDEKCKVDYIYYIK